MDRSIGAVVVGAAALGAGLWWALRARKRRQRLRHQVVLIAGGSRGLGLELARQIGARGAKIAICARDRDALARAEADLLARGVPVLAEVCDLVRPDHVRALVQSVRARWGRIDVLVFNAGRIEVGPAEHMTEADHRAAMDLHFWAPFRLIESVLPEMRRRGSGQLVNVASIGGQVPLPHLLPYTASKHALVGLSRGYRLELAREGIAVTTVLPSLVRTGSSRNALFKGRHKAEYTWFALLDNLPGTSMSTVRAARRIRRAIEDRRSEVVVGLAGRVARFAQAVAPGWTQRALAGVNALLPRAGGVGEHPMWGFASEGILTRSPLMIFGRRAERRFNQVRQPPSL